MNGPEVPESLIRLHESGRVVFFCGAGVSYPAGLPGFRGLVERVFAAVGAAQNVEESRAFDDGRFDIALDLLERRLPGGRLAVRRAVANALVPDLERPNATRTHAALLKLARTQPGSTRLVTTNFDRLFEYELQDGVVPVERYRAPMLPVAKGSKWDGLVYLHGALSEEESATSLNSLVVTSGDFGNAYLAERWAARFVSDLLRNFVVCFVGYSTDDPVMRYLIDAIAADRRMGEPSPEPFAFASARADEFEATANEWRAKGVVPVLYSEADDHAALQETLHSWAVTYGGGVRERAAIAENIARSTPVGQAGAKFHADRLRWAVTDATGFPAKKFAESTPAASLTWLDALEPLQLLGDAVDRHGSTDVANAAVRANLRRWIARHVHDSGLLLRLVRFDAPVSPQLLRFIAEHLRRVLREQRNGSANGTTDVAPDPHLARLWRLFLGGKVRPRDHFGLQDWLTDFDLSGPDFAAKSRLAELLRPCIVVEEPLRFDWLPAGEGTGGTLRVRVEPASRGTLFWFQGLRDSPHFEDLVAGFLDTVVLLLRQFAELSSFVDGESRRDDSTWVMPSIEPHHQNRGTFDSAALIEFARTGLDVVASRDPARAQSLCECWALDDLPLLRRLALHAARNASVVKSGIWVKWLDPAVADTLWLSETRREVMRLLAMNSPRLTPSDRDRLQDMILQGSGCVDAESPVLSERHADSVVWMRLARLRDAGVPLNDAAGRRISRLEELHPEWRLRDDQSDEFSHWVTVSSDSGARSSAADPAPNDAPRELDELKRWLRNEPAPTLGTSSDGRSVFESDSLLVARALRELATDGVWPTEHWANALIVWSAGEVVDTWTSLKGTVLEMPDSTLAGLSAGAVAWVRRAVGRGEVEQADFYSLSKRILEFEKQASEESGISEADRDVKDPISRAVNHPVGVLLDAAFALWYSSGRAVLSPELRRFILAVCETRQHENSCARSLVAVHTNALYDADSEWTLLHVIRQFSWTDDATVAKAMWCGYLWTAHLSPAVIEALGCSLFDTAAHFADLGRWAFTYARILVHIGVRTDIHVNDEELRRAFGKLPASGLVESAKELQRLAKQSNEEGEPSWKGLVRPFWMKFWPKEVERCSGALSEVLVQIVLDGGPHFAEAEYELRAWFVRDISPDATLEQLLSRGLAGRHPSEALDMLSRVVGVSPFRTPPRLAEFLDLIQGHAPRLRQDARFRGLQAIVDVA